MINGLSRINWTAVGVWLALAMFASHVLQDLLRPAGGIVIETDDLTGCQYLSDSHGGITPRMSAAGHQICSN